MKGKHKSGKYHAHKTVSGGSQVYCTYGYWEVLTLDKEFLSI